MIYLDNAATTSPKPQAVANACAEAIKHLCANPGRSAHATSQKAAEAIYSARSKAAELFGAESPEQVIFTQNCTQSLNMVMKGLLHPGDRVVTSSMEHNAVMRPLTRLREQGVNVDTAEITVGDPDATVRAFEAAINPGTRLVIVTHASNVCGVRLPIERIGEICFKHGVLLAVDCAQTAGVLPINVKDMHINYLCIAPHKGLYAPMGTGMLIINGELPQTIIEGGTGTASINMHQPDDMPERYESGTVNVPGICGISAGIDFVRSKGINHIYSHEMALIGRAYDGLANIRKVRLYTKKPDENFVPVLSFNIGSVNSVEAADALAKYGIATRAGLHCAPTAHKRLGTLSQGTVRICPSAFTSAYDIDRFLSAVQKISVGAEDIFY